MITLDSKWGIDSDKYNFILKERYKGKKGKNEGEWLWRDVGYFKSLTQLLRSLLQRRLKERTYNSLEELLAEVQRLDKKLTEMKPKLIEKWGTGV